MLRFYLPFPHLRSSNSLSERELAQAASVSRGVIRQLSKPEENNLTVNTIQSVAAFFERDVDVLLSAGEIFSEYSTVAIGYKIDRDGIDSWKTHLFDFVDEFRRTVDGRLIILPPPNSLDAKVLALIASSTRALCEEVGITPPAWSSRRYFLSAPWFVSEMNSLKASAILESPLAFRSNNIYVHENFLARA